MKQRLNGSILKLSDDAVPANNFQRGVRSSMSKSLGEEGDPVPAKLVQPTTDHLAINSQHQPNLMHSGIPPLSSFGR